MLNPLRAGMFNAVDGRCALSHQVILTMRYVIAERCHDSVLCIEVHDPGEAERSRRRCTGSAFWEGPDFPDFTCASIASYHLSWFATR